MQNKSRERGGGRSGWWWWGVRLIGNQELKLLYKCKKSREGGPVGDVVRMVVYEELEVIEKMQKKSWGSGEGVGQVVGERRIEVVVEMPKKSGGGGSGWM